MVEGILALAVTFAALAGTGQLVMRTNKERRPELVAWSLSLVGLSIALGAMAFGLMFGFGSGLFRTMELGGAVVAPLWLAVGMVVLISHVVQVRFATWLVAISYTIVASVIVLLDPLKGEFRSGLPKPGDHYEVVPLALIDGAHVLAVITLVACAGFTAWRARNLERAAYSLLMQVALGALAGVLVVAGTRGFLPGALAIIALGGATGLVWFGAHKVDSLGASGEEEYDDYDADYDRGHQESRRDDYGRGTGYDDLPAAGYDDRPAAGYDDLPAGGYAEPVAGFEADSGLPPAGHAAQGQFAGDGAGPDRFAAGPGSGRSQTGGALPGAALSGPATPVPVGPIAGAPPSPPPGLRFSAQDPLGAPPPVGQPAAAPVGQVVVYTLHEGNERLFDRLAAEAVRMAREAEPDLLVFTCHEVTATPTQRILYRLFRDQTALDTHERQPHVQRFTAETRPIVLAMNVVDLRLSAAKVVPLPSFLTRDLP